MHGGWFDELARALTRLQSRRVVVRAFGILAAALSGGAETVLRGEDAAAKKKNRRKHRQKQKKRRRRRRRRNACSLLPSGAECSEAVQCCSELCAENTAFPQFDAVCCRAVGASCIIGRNECCQDFSCECPDEVCFNGNPGVCG